MSKVKRKVLLDKAIPVFREELDNFTESLRKMVHAEGCVSWILCPERCGCTDGESDRPLNLMTSFMWQMSSAAHHYAVDLKVNWENGELSDIRYCRLMMGRGEEILDKWRNILHVLSCHHEDVVQNLSILMWGLIDLVREINDTFHDIEASMNSEYYDHACSNLVLVKNRKNFQEELNRAWNWDWANITPEKLHRDWNTQQRFKRK